jgi:hypothetical protein
MSKFFTRSIAAAGFAAALASSASAGFTGWTAAMTNHGSYLYVDVFAGVSVASQHLLNVFNMDIAATGATTVKDMGKVMAALKSKHGATLDMGKVNPLVKTALS